MDDYFKIFEAVDIVCLNCIEDTLEDNSVCERCPVRKLVNFVNDKMKKGEQLYE